MHFDSTVHEKEADENIALTILDIFILSYINLLGLHENTQHLEPYSLIVLILEVST